MLDVKKYERLPKNRQPLRIENLQNLRRRSELGGTLSINADEFALAALVFKLHDSFDQGKQSIVLAATDVLAGLPLRSTLSSEDIATQNVLTAELFKAKPLCR